MMEQDPLMYGKHFASMYTGSMYGKSALVFAVWGYVISHFRASRKDSQCYVELHPGMLAGVFSTTPDEVLDALAVLEAPDEASRSKDHEGRRLILLSDGRVVGPLHYLVVNGPKYKAIRDEEDRREYLKEAQRLSRAKRKNATSSTMSTSVNHGKPPSTQSEAEAEGESETDRSSSDADASSPAPAGAAQAPPWLENDPLPATPVAAAGSDAAKGPRKAKAGDGAYTQEFEDFWGVWPQQSRRSKGDAFKAFRALDALTRAHALLAVRAQARPGYQLDPETPPDPKSDRSRLPYPATWIRARRFDDEAIQVRPVGGSKHFREQRPEKHSIEIQGEEKFENEGAWP